MAVFGVSGSRWFSLKNQKKVAVAIDTMNHQDDHPLAGFLSTAATLKTSLHLSKLVPLPIVNKSLQLGVKTLIFNLVKLISSLKSTCKSTIWHTTGCWSKGKFSKIILSPRYKSSHIYTLLCIIFKKKLGSSKKEVDISNKVLFSGK